jgi:hypothetical protein
MNDDEGSVQLPAEIWPALTNKLWHATHVDKALTILSEGVIRPNAPSRYITGYCRSLGGVSLFDFRHGDDNAKQVLHCGWPMWLSGYPDDDKDEIEIGVWFEIDPTQATPHISEDTIYEDYLSNRTFDQDGRPLVRDPMPRCEACHRGSIPVSAVKGALLVDGKRLAEHEYAENSSSLRETIARFREIVSAKPPLPPTLADLLREARRRARD